MVGNSCFIFKLLFLSDLHSETHTEGPWFCRSGVRSHAHDRQGAPVTRRPKTHAEPGCLLSAVSDLGAFYVHLCNKVSVESVSGTAL